MQASTQLVIFFVWTISKLLKFTDRRTPVKANNKTTRFVFVSFVNINRIPSQDWFGTFGILYTGLFLPLVYFISFLLRLQTILPVNFLLSRIKSKSYDTLQCFLCSDIQKGLSLLQRQSFLFTDTKTETWKGLVASSCIVELCWDWWTHWQVLDCGTKNDLGWNITCSDNMCHGNLRSRLVRIWQRMQRSFCFFFQIHKSTINGLWIRAVLRNKHISINVQVIC